MKNKYTGAQRASRRRAIRRYYAKLRAAGWKGYCLYGDEQLLEEVKALVASHKDRRRRALREIKE